MRALHTQPGMQQAFGHQQLTWASLTLLNVTIVQWAAFKPAVPLVVEQLLLPAHCILLPGNTIQVRGARVGR